MVTRRAALHCAIVHANQEGGPAGQLLRNVKVVTNPNDDSASSTSGHQGEVDTVTTKDTGVKRVSNKVVLVLIVNISEIYDKQHDAVIILLLCLIIILE